MHTLTSSQIWMILIFIVLSIGGGLYMLARLLKRTDITEDRKKQLILMFSVAQFIAFIAVFLVFALLPHA